MHIGRIRIVCLDMERIVTCLKQYRQRSNRGSLGTLLATDAVIGVSEMEF
jgi:hypothetical protein